MKWYAYNDEDGKYTMILDHNTTASTAWNSNIDATDNTEILKKLEDDTIENNWNKSLNPRLISAEEIAEICKKTNFIVYHPPSSWFYFEDLSQNKETGSGNVCSKTGCKYAWLYDRTNYNCTEYGCFNNSNNDNILDTVGYWTSSPILNFNFGNAWEVSYDGSLIELVTSYIAYAPGIRPVITVKKSDLLQ